MFYFLVVIQRGRLDKAYATKIKIFGYLSALSVETSGNERDRVDVPDKAPNRRHELVQIPSPSRGDNRADEYHPGAEDVLQPYYMKMSFVAACARILMAGKSRRGSERKVASTWRN